MRRLPIYLLLDCSESMAGEPFTAMQRGLGDLLAALRSDPYALESVYVSVITFANSANMALPLTELTAFRAPELVMGSGTALGDALSVLEKSIQTDVVKSTPDRKGDFKPICIILTDGEPTDNWTAIADRFKSQLSGKKAFVVGVACGPEAGVATLRRITEDVLMSKDISAETLKKLFKWVSASVSTASQAIEQTGKETGINLEKIPLDCLEKATAKDEKQAQSADRYAYLHAKCIKSKAFYIMRYEKGGEGVLRGASYRPVAAHKVEQFDFSGTKGDQKSLQASQISAPVPCPYCGNEIWGMCSCGHIHCCPKIKSGAVELTCPWCGKTQQYGYGGNFGVGGGRG